MSSRAFLNSFMLCPRLRAKSGNFFAPKRTRTMRRIINRSGPPRFPIPNASIFITILNWLSLMFYSSRSAIYVLKCTDRFSLRAGAHATSRARAGSLLVRLSCLRPTVPLIRERRSPLMRLLSAISCGFMKRGGVKTAAFPDLKKLSGPPHSRRRQPRMRIHHDPNARHYSHL